jgi:hypothetical protein
MEEEALQHKITFVMQQLEIWFCKNDVTVYIEKNIKKKHEPYHFIPTKTDILVDFASSLIAIKLHKVQN